MWRHTIVLLAVAALTAAAPQTAAADWLEPFESAAPVNSPASRSALTSSLASVAGRPTVAWAQDATLPGAGNASAIHVARLSDESTAWREIPGSDTDPISRLGTASSYNPSLADVGGVPWVAWEENLTGPADAQVRVARPAVSGQGWERVVDTDRPINHLRTGPSRATAPVIAGAPGGRPYVAYWEFDPGEGSAFMSGYEPGRIWVVRLSADGRSWEPVGGGTATALATDSGSPDIAVVDGRPWVSYVQVGTSGRSLQIRVARLADDGRSWEQVGGAVAEGGFDEIGQADIADGGGVPMLAYPYQGRVRTLVLSPSGKSWQPLGGGAASPAGANASQPSVAEVGGAPWVTWRENGEARAARLADGAWKASGGPISGPRGQGFGDGPHLAAVGGLPWVAFTQDDGAVPGGPGSRGCCDQVRVTRLTPDWGDARAYPASTTAALLLPVQTFGLRYGLGVQYGTDGGAGAFSPFSPANADLAVHELRGLTPGTLYWYQPFATAGTPARVMAPREHCATPPAGEIGLPAAAPPATPILALLRGPSRVRRGHTVVLQLLSTAPGDAVLTVRRGRRAVARSARSVPAGRWRMKWQTARAKPGRYRLTVMLRARDGHSVQERAWVRVLPRRR
jgi:hypothetical protein